MNIKKTSEKQFTQHVLERITAFMSVKRIKQTDLAKMSNMSQSTLSKIMNQDMKLTLQHIFKICKALNIEPVELFLGAEITGAFSAFEDDNACPDIGVINDCYINEQILIRDTKHPAFKGYVNNDFLFYCYSTISTESALLEGTICFEEAENGNYCKAKLSLYTGKMDSHNQKIYKHYYGELIISLTMGSCYVILINAEIGEILTMTFKHTFLFNQELVCRVGAITSTSSGGNRLPVMQRALLSKHQLHVSGDNTEDLEFVKGQLKLNESTILVSHESIEKLMNIQDSVLQDFFTKCQNSFQELPYKIVDESKIRAIDVPSDVKAQAISLLRNQSTALKYNKISTKTEEFVFQYIKEKLK